MYNILDVYKGVIFMKEKFFLILKGIVLGISFILPGVSGGVLSVVMGIYDKLIEAVSHFYESWASFKKYFNFLFFLGIGGIISVLVLTNVIEVALDKMPVITILIFVGLIVGGVPQLFNIIKKDVSFGNILLMFIGIGLLVIMSVTTGGASNQIIDTSFISMLKMFGVGILASATIVIPGVSGSFLLMVMGYYEPLLKIINEITSLTNLYNNVVVMIPFGIGLVIGAIVIAKLIDFCLKKYPVKTYYVIIGFVIASIIEVFLSVFEYSYTIPTIIIGLILMVFSSLIVYKFFEK